MLDGLSFDQLRIFIAAADEGSFSAAGRRLHRAQSVISQGIANLEAQVGVPLFERAGRYPVLTEAGRLLLADARAVAASVNALKTRAKGMAAGLEPELAVAIDVMFPMSVLTQAAAGFGAKFPTIPLRLYVEALGGVAQAVREGLCQLGVIGTLPLNVPGMVSERLLGVEFVFVAAPSHPLGQTAGPVPVSELARHVQLVLTDRTDLSKGREFGVMSPRNWRLADLGAKHAFLLAGLGWGGLPLAMVARDLREDALRKIQLQDMPSGREIMPMSATYRADKPPGPAGRWFIEQLKHFAAAEEARRAQ
ncbi:MAG TPA: LysR family transcriptional regulator [Acidocella sp.]|nr:MAG: LysR family transcriptional regulator [Acidocella sp. 20-61-6]HQT47560.1 LysR family transcriptional regulator [Acidocella sp.]